MAITPSFQVGDVGSIPITRSVSSISNYMTLFKTVKEIVSKEGILYFKRYAIIECKFFNIYIHYIYQSDKDKHLHDHPWNYTSIVLSGSFREKHKPLHGESPFKNLCRFNISRAKANRFHKILKLRTKKVITLFFTGPRIREWGYEVDGKWVDHISYRNLKNSGNL